MRTIIAPSTMLILANAGVTMPMRESIWNGRDNRGRSQRAQTLAVTSLIELQWGQTLWAYRTCAALPLVCSAVLEMERRNLSSFQRTRTRLNPNAAAMSATISTQSF